MKTEKNIYFIYLDAFSNTGGIEEFNKKIIRSFENISKKNGFENYRINIISIYDENFHYHPINQNINFVGYSGNRVKAVFEIIKKVEKKDIIFFGHINLLPLAILNIIINGVKKIFFSIYGIEVWKKFNFLESQFLKKFSFLSISNYTKNEFSKNSGVNPKNIQIFPCCIEIIKNEESIKNPYKQSDFNVLTVSRLSSNDTYKGIDHVIQALPLIIKKIPNIKFTIIGKGDDKLRLQKICKKLKVDEYVDFRGYVEKLDPYYKFCNLFTLPSKNEGFGIVFLEAMQYKKPVLSCNSGGSQDVIKNNETGFHSIYGDLDSINDMILFIYNNKEHATNIGNAGYKHLMQNFTFRNFQDRLEKILKTL